MQTKSIIIAILIMVITVLSAAAETAPADKNIADIYLENLLKGDYEACYMMSSSEVQEALSAQQLKETWESIVSQVGEFEGVIQITEEEKTANLLYIYALNFTKMVLDMKIFVDDKGVINGLLFNPSSVTKPGTESEMPDYLSPDKIVAEEIEFNCEGMQVHGMLTLPTKTESYPLVMMLTGSGPNDMDETIGLRKPFRDLANGLANIGIASLRWNKRTRDYPERFMNDNSFTVEDEYLPELSAALKWVEANDSIKASKYFVLGHSMGAFILPKTATEIKNLAGFIMLAANARPLEDLVLEQYTYIFGLTGVSTEDNEEFKQITEQVNAVKELAADNPAPDGLLLGASKAYWLSLNNYDQLQVFSGLDKPFIILQGEKDYQVSMKDFELWEKAAKDKKQVNLISYPDLDHLFMYCEGESTPDTYLNPVYNPAYVSDEVISDIANWIKKR